MKAGPYFLLIMIVPFLFGFESGANQCGTFQFIDPNNSSIGINQAIPPQGAVQIGFKFDPQPTCQVSCQCNTVAYIQIIRVFNSQRTGFVFVDQETSFRMVKNQEYWLSGWAVDRQPRRTSGYYGYVGTGDSEAPSAGIQPGDNINWAILTDKPGDLPDGAIGEVISFAVCRDKDANCPDCILGSYFWAFTLGSNGTVTITTHYEGKEWHQDALYHAILNWNREAERLGKSKLPEHRHLTQLGE
jgi:hypothetical protein